MGKYVPKIYFFKHRRYTHFFGLEKRANTVLWNITTGKKYYIFSKCTVHLPLERSSEISALEHGVSHGMWRGGSLQCIPARMTTPTGISKATDRNQESHTSFTSRNCRAISAGHLSLHTEVSKGLSQGPNQPPCKSGRGGADAPKCSVLYENPCCRVRLLPQFP